MTRQQSNGQQGRPSRTRLKKESRALQALGEALIDVRPDELEKLALPGRLLEALADARRIRKHEALRRQRQYIGRLMREIDPEPVQRFLEARSARARNDNRLFHAAEDWRRRLLEERQSAVPQCAMAVGMDSRELAEKLAAVLDAPTEPLRKAASRDLFRRLHDAICAADSSADG